MWLWIMSINCQAVVQSSFGFIVFLLAQVNLAERERGIKCFRIELECFFQGMLSLVPLLQVHVGRAKFQLRLNKLGVDCNCSFQVTNFLFNLSRSQLALGFLELGIRFRWCIRVHRSGYPCWFSCPRYGWPEP